MLAARLVEPVRIAADAAVHHVAGAHEVDAPLRQQHRHVGEHHHALVVEDRVALHQAAVAVRGVRAEAHVGEERQLRARRDFALE